VPCLSDAASLAATAISGLPAAGVSGGPVQANAPRASGDGGMEALRVLKRRLSDVYRALQADAASPDIKIAA
jgi:hypothetical protein